MTRTCHAVALLLLAGTCLLAANQAISADPSEAPPDPVWRASSMVLQDQIRELHLSPDGSRLVWVQRRPEEKKDRLVGDLRLTVLDQAPEPVTRKLTRTADSDSSPRFSPDGSHIAFLSDREIPDAEDQKLEEPQVWIIPADGGEPWHLTSFARGVEGFDWLDDSHLVVAASPDPDLHQRRLDEDKDDTEVVEDVATWVPVRLWLMALDGKDPKPITRNQDEIDLFAVDRVKRRVAARHLVDPHWEADHRGTPRISLTSIDDGSSRDLPVQRELVPESLAFTGGGEVLLATYTHTNDTEQLAAGQLRLGFWRKGMMRFAAIPALGNEDVLEVVPTGNGAVVLLGEGTLTSVAELAAGKDGFELRRFSGDGAVQLSELAASPDGRRLAAVRSRANRPCQLWSLKRKGLELEPGTQLSRLNPQLDDKPLAEVEVVRWTGAEGDTVEGLLFAPTRRYSEGPAPLVVMIHGGPAGADNDLWDDDWASPAHILCQRGAYVLKPNYHGSSAYGRSFVESIRGRYYELEVPDILAGIDALAERGLIDPERVGLSGWSNGSILAIALSLERHFKAVSAGAGDVNWASDFGNCAFGPWFDRYYLGADPWTDPQLYIAKSPLFEMEKVQSPTIIFFGDEDTAVPTEQGREHFRAMQQIGAAPVRFLLFPGEPHSFRKLTHQQRKLEEEMAWFDRYLFERPPQPQPDLPDASPLAMARLAAGLERHDGVLGVVSVDGVVLPQTVVVAALPGIEVGVTELTRAQWAAFTGEPVATGFADLPAVVPSGERARAYCAWLSKQTGRRSRLLSKEEHDRLVAAKRETRGTAATLDLWAGSELTRDDARLLRESLAGNGSLVALVKPVASTGAALLPHPGAGPWDPEAVLFDLEGNLAEWVSDGDNTVATGASVMRAEVEADEEPIAGEPVGLRIAVELNAPNS